MSYNGSGTFVINSTGQPVVTGTVISSSTFNSLTADLGTGLSTAITKDGQTTTTAKIPFAQGLSAAVASNFAAGTVGAPSIYLSTDTTTGLYRIGANNDGFAISGVKLLDLSSALVGITGALTVSTTLGVSGTVAQGASPATISGSGVAANGASAKGTWVTHQQNTQSVSTVAKTIATSSFASATSTGVLYVYGYYSGFAFMDVIYFSTQSTLVTVVSSTTINGSPNPRTYTMSGPAVQLSITTNTYSVNVFGFESSNPT